MMAQINPENTGPTKFKDFLLGLLFLELGRIQHKGHSLNALILVLTRISWPEPLGLFGRNVRLFFLRFLAGSHTLLMDAHAAVNGALYHLIQYLYFRKTWNLECLTFEGDQTEMDANARTICERLTSSPPFLGENETERTHLKKRLFWLSHFLNFPMDTPDTNQKRRWFTVRRVFALLGLFLLGHELRRSIDYHPIYIARMDSQRKLLDQPKAPHGQESKDERKR